jgi:C1A family cysteine protease
MWSGRLPLSVFLLAAVLLFHLSDACCKCKCKRGKHHDHNPLKIVEKKPEPEDKEWKDFKKEHKKVYDDPKENARRRGLWKANTDKIKKHNKEATHGKHTYRMRSNKLADWSFQEIENLLGARRSNKLKSYDDCEEFVEPAGFFNNVPISKNWVADGIVTPVKDQGNASTCYAFATAATMESRVARYTGHFADLSEQQIVDCSQSHGNLGTNGGMPYRTFGFVADNGLAAEADYPYTGQDQTCDTNVNPAVIIEGCARLPEYDERYLKAAVAKEGTIAVVMDVRESLVFYFDGVYEESACTDPDNFNHAVVAVGYGTVRSVGDYWLIRNSWGSDWGDEGYFKLARNKNNMCSIATECTFPLNVETT